MSSELVKQINEKAKCPACEEAWGEPDVCTCLPAAPVKEATMVDACYFCQRPLGSVFTYHWGNPCHSECVPMDEKDRRIASLRAELEHVKRERDEALAKADAHENANRYLHSVITGDAEAAERLAGARVKIGPLAHVVAEMLERAGETRPNGDILHDILAQAIPAALAEPAGEAEQVATGDPLDGMEDRVSAYLAATPPDASAIREALNTAIYRLCLIENKQALNEGEKALVREWIAEARTALAGAKP